MEDLITIDDRANHKKHMERSNEEIDKIIESTDKEIATVKDFLSPFSRKSLPPVAVTPKSVLLDKHVESNKEQEETTPFKSKLPQPQNIEETP